MAFGVGHSLMPEAITRIVDRLLWEVVPAQFLSNGRSNCYDVRSRDG